LGGAGLPPRALATLAVTQELQIAAANHEGPALDETDHGAAQR